MKPKELGALVLLSALWGSSYIYFRIAAPVLGPLPLAWLRVAVAGGALVLYLAVRSPGMLRLGRFWPFLVLGALNGAIPYALIAAAEVHITASYAAVLNATTPLFSAMIGVLFLRDRLSREGWIGVLLGIVGVGIVVGWSPVAMDRVMWLSVLAMLLSSVTYALGATYAKRSFDRPVPMQLAVGQQLGALAILTPVLGGLVVGDQVDIHVTGEALLAVAILGLLCTAFAYLLYFFLIGAVGPTRTVSVTILSPIFGVIWSALFLDEAITAGALVGTAVILISVWFVIGRPGAGGKAAR